MASKISIAQVMKMQVRVDENPIFFSIFALFPLQQLSTHYISASPFPLSK